MRLFILLIVLLVSLFNISYAIQVSCDVFGTWSAEDNPYEVIGDLHVPQCSTLVIEAGCYIDFQGYYKFEIDTNAVFRALGSETDSIVFTTADTITCWEGIMLYSTDSLSEFTYCVIEYCKSDLHNPDHRRYGRGICAANSMISIVNSSIRFNDADEGYGGGIYCCYSNLSIINSTILGNHASRGGSGVYCDTSSVVIDNCLIEYNETFSPLGGEYGGGSIGCERSDVKIYNNII